MTIRAVILGLLGALVIAAIGFINDSVLRLTMLVGNHFPISVFGLLILLVIALNPLLSLIRRSWRFQPGELAVIVTFMLVACSIPGSGLLRTYTPMMAMPISHEQIKPGWQRSHVLDRLPPDTLVPRIENAESPGRLVPDPDVMGPLATGLRQLHRAAAHPRDVLRAGSLGEVVRPAADVDAAGAADEPGRHLPEPGCPSAMVAARAPAVPDRRLRDDTDAGRPRREEQLPAQPAVLAGAGGHSGDSRHQRDSRLVPAVRRGPARDRPDAGGQVLALLQDVGRLVGRSST